MNKPYFNNVDVYRGIAALLVFIGHLRNAYFKDYADIEDNNYLIVQLCGYQYIQHHQL